VPLQQEAPSMDSSSTLKLNCQSFQPTSIQAAAKPFIPSKSAIAQDNMRFPAGGWYCNKCLNYNYKGRKSCNRCKQPMCYKIEAEKQMKVCKFPSGGWECSKCCNYNFKGRRNCYRCKKEKTDEDMEGMPEHIYENMVKATEAASEEGYKDETLSKNVPIPDNNGTFEMINFKHKQ
jgi:hypothetical protein